MASSYYQMNEKIFPYKNWHILKLFFDCKVFKINFTKINHDIFKKIVNLDERLEFIGKEVLLDVTLLLLLNLK